jgi:hypothetical protein
MQWYEILLIITGGLFFIQSVILPLFGGLGLDVDVDTDFTDVNIPPVDSLDSVGNALTFTDIISFKGLLHFLIGFSLTITLAGELTFSSASFGVFVGLVFVFVLYYLYKFLYKNLQQNMTYTNILENIDGTVYYWDKDKRSGEVFVVLEGRLVNITLNTSSDRDFTQGEKIKVSGTRNLVYDI